MGWANCGEDDLGRQIGYAWPATCDYGLDTGGARCPERIDRGLSYVCGGMHGGSTWGCGRYFCEFHLTIIDVEGEDRPVQVCRQCAADYECEHQEE